MSKKNGHHQEKIPKQELLQNTTPIPNVVLDEWLAFLSPAETKVVFYVARRTRGWGRDWDRISLKQMMNGIVRRDGSRLDKGTGLGETACRRAVRSLLSRGVLRREETASKNGASEPPWYSLNLSWKAEGVPESNRGRVSQSDRGEGVTKCPPGRGSQSDSHKSPSLRFSPAGGDELGEVSELVSSFQKARDDKNTPPSSSSCPGSITNPGEQRKLFGDDEKTKNHSQTQGEYEERNRSNGEAFSKAAAKKSPETLAAEIETIPEAALSEEARRLDEKLKEKIPRIESSKAMRLCQKCIDTGSVAKLGDVVARCEENCRDGKVRNAYMYLVSSLFPLENAGPEEAPAEAFSEAYEAVVSTHLRDTEGYSDEFVEEEEEFPTVDEDIRRSLEILQAIEGWPRNPEDDQEALAALEEHYEEVAKRVPLHSMADDYVERIRSAGGLANALATAGQTCPLSHLRAHLCEEVKFWRRVL